MRSVFLIIASFVTAVMIIVSFTSILRSILPPWDEKIPPIIVEVDQICPEGTKYYYDMSTQTLKEYISNSLLSPQGLCVINSAEAIVSEGGKDN